VGIEVVLESHIAKVPWLLGAYMVLGYPHLTS